MRVVFRCGCNCKLLHSNCWVLCTCTTVMEVVQHHYHQHQEYTNDNDSNNSDNDNHNNDTDFCSSLNTTYRRTQNITERMVSLTRPLIAQHHCTTLQLHCTTSNCMDLAVYLWWGILSSLWGLHPSPCHPLHHTLLAAGHDPHHHCCSPC